MYWIVTTGNYDDRPQDAVAWITDGTEEDAVASLLDYNTISEEEDPEDVFIPADFEQLSEMGIWWTFTKATHVMVRRPSGLFESVERDQS